MFVYIFGFQRPQQSGLTFSRHFYRWSRIYLSVCYLWYVFYTLQWYAHWLANRIQVGAFNHKVVKAYISGILCHVNHRGFHKQAATLPKRMVELEYLQMSKSAVDMIEMVGNVVFWIVVGFFGVWVISKFVVNIGKLREDDDDLAHALGSVSSIETGKREGRDNNGDIKKHLGLELQWAAALSDTVSYLFADLPKSAEGKPKTDWSGLMRTFNRLSKAHRTSSQGDEERREVCGQDNFDGCKKWTRRRQAGRR